MGYTPLGVFSMHKTRLANCKDHLYIVMALLISLEREASSELPITYISVTSLVNQMQLLPIGVHSNYEAAHTSCSQPNLLGIRLIHIGLPHSRQRPSYRRLPRLLPGERHIEQFATCLLRRSAWIIDCLRETVWRRVVSSPDGGRQCRLPTVNVAAVESSTGTVPSLSVRLHPPLRCGQTERRVTRDNTDFASTAICRAILFSL